METSTSGRQALATAVATPVPAPTHNPAHQGMVNFLAEVMHRHERNGHAASEVLMRQNRQEAQLAASPVPKLLNQYAAYAAMVGTNPQEYKDTVIACAEAKHGKDFFCELHCEALDKLDQLEHEASIMADREYAVTRAAALLHYLVEDHLANRHYLTHNTLDTFLASQQLDQREVAAARALFMLFQREKIPRDAADKKQYHARAMKRPDHVATTYAAGD